jgi:serine/threonine protein kinase
MSQRRKVIGEGAYGCVHKPSIHCKSGLKANFNYDEYVSKIMKTDDAEDELKEFIVIGSYDKTDEFHLGAPIMCPPDLTHDVIANDITKCKHIRARDVKEKPDKYKLLLLKFGGPDLKELCNAQLVKYLKTNKNKKVDLFLLEVHRLLRGLKFLKQNGLVHNDIKPQNILFNTKTGELKYIDFGLMRKKEVIIESSNKDDNFLGIFHWSYPFECGFMNKKFFKKYSSSSLRKREEYLKQLSNLIVTKSEVNTLKLPIRHPDAFNILFTYINPEGIAPLSAAKYSYIQHFFDGFNELIDSSSSYSAALNTITDSIDVFGLGFTMQYILNCFKRQNAVNIETFTRLSAFFHKMYDFNPSTREINIDILINEYETIMLETGILVRQKKDFENNILVNRAPISKTTLEKMVKEDSLSSRSLSRTLENVAKLDAHVIGKSSNSNSNSKKKSINKSKRCAPNKELNKRTRRCVKRCPVGTQRNLKGRCRRTNVVS